MSLDLSVNFSRYTLMPLQISFLFKLMVVCVLCGFSLLSTANVTAGTKRIKLAVSTHPLALVVKAVVGDAMDISVIIPKNSDPHSFSLRPSDVLNVQRSEHLIWLGPNMEPFLSKLMVTVPEKKQITLAESRELNWLYWREDSHGHHGNESDLDPHIWGSYKEMLKFASMLTDLLSEKYPTHSKLLSDNFLRFEQSINEFAKQYQQKLVSQDLSQIVFYHDAFQYFEHDFELETSGFILKDLEQKLSVREMIKFQKLISQRQVNCALVEPGYSEKLLNKLFGRNEFKIIELDPLGYNISLKPSGYLEYLQSIVHQIDACHS